MRRFFADSLEAYLGDLSGKSVLDIGSGTGYCANVFEKLGAAEYIGLEPSAKNIAISRAKYPKLQIIKSTLEEADIDRTFDLAVSVLVFEHIADPGKAFGKIRSFLTDGGSFFLICSDIGVFSAPRFDVTVEFEELGNGERAARTTYPLGVLYDVLRPLENYVHYAARVGLMLERHVPLYPTEALLKAAPRYERFNKQAFVHLLIFRKG